MSAIVSSVFRKPGPAIALLLCLALLFPAAARAREEWVEEVEPPPELPEPKEESEADREEKADEDAESKIRIDKIRIEGNKSINGWTLKSILHQEKTPWYRSKPKDRGYDPFWADNDRLRLERYYKSKGYYNVKVTGPLTEFKDDGKGVVVTYRVVEGEPVKVKKAEIVLEDGRYQPDDLEEIWKLVELGPGDVFELDPYQDGAGLIEGFYQDRGFFRVKVKRQAIVDPDALSADVTYRVVRGARYRIKTITIKGCEQTNEEVVWRSIDIEEGDWYSREQVFRNQRRVQRLPVYQVVRFIENPDDETHKMNLVISVDEGKAREVKLGVGWGDQEGVRVQGGWRHVNFLGGARELSVSARWSRLLEREEIKIIQPNVRRPGDFIQVAGERRIEREPAYTHTSLALKPTYHFIITDYLWSEVSYRIEDNRLSDIQDRLELEEEDLAREGLLSAAGYLIDWADVDDRFNPAKGAHTIAYAEYGGGFMGGDFNYYKVWGEARGYWPIGPVVGAMRWRLGYAEPLGAQDRIPLFLRYYAGGTGSVRGYDRHELGPQDPSGDPIGGAKMWEGSIEFRFPIYGDFSGVVFEDSGWVWAEDKNFDPEDVAHGYGFGFRYNTAIGPVGVDIGLPLQEDVDFADVRLHFNIGHSF